MKYIKSFDTVSALNTAVATTPIELLGTACDTVKTTRGPLTPTPPDDELWYTSSTGAKVDPSTEDWEGHELPKWYDTNVYENGKGIIKCSKPLTKIPFCAFYSQPDITSVTFPNSLRVIGEGAFHSCESLVSVGMSNGIITIERSAFAASAITSITIPNSVTSIGEYAFADCYFLRTVHIYSTCAIPNYCFDGSSAIESCSMPDGLVSFSGVPFSSEALKELIIPNGTYFPLTGTNNLNGLETLKIGTLTSVYNSIYLPASNLSSISVDIGHETCDSRDDCNAIIKTDTNTLLLGGLNTVIPSTVASIWYRAFEGRTALKKLTCKATTPPTIYNGSGVGDYYFLPTNNLQAIYVPAASVDTYKAADGWRKYDPYIQAIQE